MSVHRQVKLLYGKTMAEAENQVNAFLKQYYVGDVESVTHSVCIGPDGTPHYYFAVEYKKDC